MIGATTEGWKLQQDDDDAEEADRQVHVEDQVPTEGVGEPAAEGGANKARESEHCSEQSLVASALFCAVEIANGRECDWEECTSTESLNSSEEDQLLNRLREASERRSEKEEPDASEEEWFAAVHVRKFPVDGYGHGAGEEVDRDDPCVEVCAIQIGDDLGECGANNRLVERPQEEGEHDRNDDALLCALGEILSREVACGEFCLRGLRGALHCRGCCRTRGATSWRCHGDLLLHASATCCGSSRCHDHTPRLQGCPHALGLPHEDRHRR